MLTLDLNELDREGRVSIETAIEPDSELFADAEFVLVEPMPVRAQAILSGTGELVVHGRVRGTLRFECGRCLDPVDLEVDQEVVLVFGFAANADAEDDGDIRPIGRDAASVDLGDAVREEVLLALFMDGKPV